MSDQSQGEGWWQASDGKWYPPPRPDVAAQPTGSEPAATEPVPPVTQPTGPSGPPTAPPFGPPPAAGVYGPPGSPPLGAPPGGPPDQPKKGGLGRGPIIGIIAAAVVLIAALAFFLTRDDGNKDNIAATSSDKTEQTDRSDRSDNTDKSTDESTDKTTSSSSVEIPPGFKELRDETEGVSIAVPNDFVEIDPSLFLNNSNQSDFASQNPDLAPFISSGNEFLKGSVLAASGESGGNPAFVVVAKSPQRFDPSDTQFATELEDGLRAAGGTDITTDTTTIPAGEALRVGVTLNINAGATSGSVTETLYFVTVGRTTWAVIGVSVGGDAGNLFDQIANTFTVES